MFQHFLPVMVQHLEGLKGQKMAREAEQRGLSETAFCENG
jgi:predicted PhzF superfamily epimerase YddE/YHI9